MAHGGSERKERERRGGYRENSLLGLEKILGTKEFERVS